MIQLSLVVALAVCPIFLPATSTHQTSSHTRELTSSQHQRMDLIRRLIDSKAWAEISKQVRIGAKSREITLHDLQTLALTYPGTPFALAVFGTKNILSLSEKTGLPFQVAFPIALFAETTLADEIARGTLFWSDHRFGRELQYDPETHQFFIHLGTKGVEAIGEGRKKVVTKTILYDRSQPEVLARGCTEWDITSEFTAMSRLESSPCVLHAKALMRHTNPSSKKAIMTIVTPLFRPGSLQSVIDNHSLKLTFKERLKIACDIITGLGAMHQKLYVHRDLGARNYFVDIEGKKPGHRRIRAVVADLGRTLALVRAYKVPVQGNACYLSPEGFFRSKMMGFDYFNSDVFAMGCVMWQIYFGELPAWGKKRFFRMEGLPLKKRYQKHMKLLKHTRTRPLKYLHAKHKKMIPLTFEDRFLALILQMTDPDPAQRGKAVDLRTQFQALLKEVEE